MMQNEVKLNDIENALANLGINKGDIVLVHSSLKSFGRVEGGAETVIAAFKNVLTPDGTLVMPTLSQKNFSDALYDWNIDRPSDTGFITETFRKMPNTLRSDQETHSVSAWGKYAHEITCEHKAYGPRYGVFGEWAFSRSSPWQKMYDMHAKIVFLGVTMLYNTFKHFIEYRIVNDVLDNVAENEYENCKSEISYMLNPNLHEGIWPFYGAEKMQIELEKLNLIRHTDCGNAHILCVSAYESCNAADRIIRENITEWVDEPSAVWLKKYGNY